MASMIGRAAYGDTKK